MKNIYTLILLWIISLSLVSCNWEIETITYETEVIPQEQELQSEAEELIETISLIAEEVLAEDILETPILDAPIESELSQEEITSLIHMREEEKLARDVYLTLYETWGQKIFSNIASSEQTHTDAVKTLLSAYKIEDPVTDDSVWVFQIPEMQELYDTLIAQWNLSLGDALTVWAIIEDLDIYDIQEFKKDITNEDILKIYDNLERGSRNHMRAFTKNLSKLGITYTPSYISELQYQEIIASEQERGNWGWNGFGWGKH